MKEEELARPHPQRGGKRLSHLIHGVQRQTVRLLEGETGRKEAREGQRNGPGWSDSLWGWMSPNVSQHGGRARPSPLMLLDLAFDGGHPASAFQTLERLENPAETSAGPDETTGRQTCMHVACTAAAA